MSVTNAACVACGRLGCGCTAEGIQWQLRRKIATKDVEIAALRAELATVKEQTRAEIDRLMDAQEEELDAMRDERDAEKQRADEAEESRKVGLKRIDFEMATTARYKAKRDAALAREAQLREALENILAFGVEFDDDRLKYITAQIDRVDIEEARAALATPPGEWLEKKLREVKIGVIEALKCYDADAGLACCDMDYKISLCPRCTALVELRKEGGKR